MMPYSPGSAAVVKPSRWHSPRMAVFSASTSPKISPIPRPRHTRSCAASAGYRALSGHVVADQDGILRPFVVGVAVIWATP